MLGGLVGVGWRRELSQRLLADAHRVGFVEVVAETCRDPELRREAVAISSVWPVVPHGVKLSLGSAAGIDDDAARDLGRLARELRAPCVSEHVSFVRAAGHEIGHLTDLPRTREAVRAVAANVERLRTRLPDVPLLLENVASTFTLGDEHHEMSEPDFYGEIVSATDCDLLLDVGNLHANAVNAGLDSAEVLAQFPLQRVAMLHVAGGVLEDGFYFDTHAHPVPDAVFDLVARVRSVKALVPVLLERDADFDAQDEILSEIDRLARRDSKPLPMILPVAPRKEAGGGHALGEIQNALAASLVAGTDDPRFDRESIARARRVLRKKRADDALPLLGRLRWQLSSEQALSFGAIESTPRLGKMTAVRDAWKIAQGARAVPDLCDSAIEDALVLRARFVDVARAPRRRALPFVGRDRLASGEVLWALKNVGTDAPVRVMRG
jgi:uncharacterized protein (UPF0276 family)